MIGSYINRIGKQQNPEKDHWYGKGDKEDDLRIRHIYSIEYVGGTCELFDIKFSAISTIKEPYCNRNYEEYKINIIGHIADDNLEIIVSHNKKNDCGCGYCIFSQYNTTEENIYNIEAFIILLDSLIEKDFEIIDLDNILTFLDSYLEKNYFDYIIDYNNDLPEYYYVSKNENEYYYELNDNEYQAVCFEKFQNLSSEELKKYFSYSYDVEEQIKRIHHINKIALMIKNSEFYKKYMCDL